MLLPAIATTFGVTAGAIAVSVLAIVGIGLMTFIYRTPEVPPAGGVERSGISAGTNGVRKSGRFRVKWRARRDSNS
ncbi:hypothetical protein X743_25020 [Mesorhizobium sp. LNHC252B00]|nr:hypothetical protein X743_25020 [Mesorhizobium sp. LNHC252B00]